MNRQGLTVHQAVTISADYAVLKPSDIQKFSSGLYCTSDDRAGRRRPRMKHACAGEPTTKAAHKLLNCSSQAIFTLTIQRLWYGIVVSESFCPFLLVHVDTDRSPTLPTLRVTYYIMGKKEISRKEKVVVPPDYLSLGNDYRDSELGDQEDNMQQQPLYRHPPRARKHRTALIFHGLIICLYIIIGVSYFQDGPLRNSICGTSSMLFSEYALIRRLVVRLLTPTRLILSTDTRSC